MSQPPMVALRISDDQAYLAAVGTVAILHLQLDHALRMTIRALADLTVSQAEYATAGDTSHELRRRILKLARQRLGEGRALLHLQAIIGRCRVACIRRDNLLHGLLARESDGEPAVGTAHDQTRRPSPTLDELKALADELCALIVELSEAGSEGFLCEALQASRTG